MNRYAATGILLDAAQGKQIIVLVLRHSDVRDAINELASNPVLADRDMEVKSQDGRALVKFPRGGQVRVFLANSRMLRGLSADVVFLDEGVDELLRSREFYDELHAVTAAAGNGEVIRA